jgi:5-methylcytosine-specific restriction endonuclease McrA
MPSVRVYYKHSTSYVPLAKAERMVREGRGVWMKYGRSIRIWWNNSEFRRYILERDHYTCAYCGGYGNTIDHVIPRSQGGLSTPANCVCACRKCNEEKANRTPEQWRMQDKVIATGV